MLDHTNSSVATGRLDDDERAALNIVYPGHSGIAQTRSVTGVNESGLYSLILSSPKPDPPPTSALPQVPAGSI